MIGQLLIIKFDSKEKKTKKKYDEETPTNKN